MAFSSDWLLKFGVELASEVNPFLIVIFNIRSQTRYVNLVSFSLYQQSHVFLKLVYLLQKLFVILRLLLQGVQHTLEDSKPKLYVAVMDLLVSTLLIRLRTLSLLMLYNL